MPPLQYPARLALGGLGVLHLTGSTASSPATRLDWRGNHPTLLSESGASVQSGARWETHPALKGPGLNAVIPLDDRALTSARHQDFPIVGARSYAEQWGPAVVRGARDLAEYSPLASAAVERFVTNVLPLLCGDHAIGSASRQEALGLVFLPAIVDRPDQVAECLLHEAMHQYLFRLEACAKLFDPASPLEEKFLSPWRRDRRPLRMTLHGSFVFCAIADLYLWVAQSPRWGLDAAAAHRRAYQRYRESSLALDIVERHGVMSEIGAKVTRAIRQDLAGIGARLAPRHEDVIDVDRAIDEHLRAYSSYLH